MVLAQVSLAVSCQTRPTAPPRPADPAVAELERRTLQAESLDWFIELIGPNPRLAVHLSRSEVAVARRRAAAAGDAVEEARAAAVLAAEANERAVRVLERWTGALDRETGLLPKGFAEDDQVWDYADAGADLFPHLLIAATLLRPDLAPDLRAVIAAERRVPSINGLPRDVDLRTDRSIQGDLEDRIYGAVEYAKDGLLPLTERLGPGPWLERLQELARAIDDQSPVRTPFGLIPSQDSEVNGQALQVFVRLYWLTGEERYFRSAQRIARSYLESALPRSGHLPVRSWSFDRGRALNDRLQLRDHGNEIIAGLVEFHLIESLRDDPDLTKHRLAIRAMLDRLLAIGRTQNGLWKSALDPGTGETLQDTLSDNWGYIFAAYLTQVQIERAWPVGDSADFEHYRAATRRGLGAAAQLEFYPWQGVEPDGYADTIESALYLLNRESDPDAAAWVDRQAGTLFGAQEADGRVEDRYLDGNFVRTALLYSAWQTQGVRTEPWAPGLLLGGAAAEGGCVVLSLTATTPWHGRLVFDQPRHDLYLHLPFNYPRLNEWPEWFTARAEAQYRLDDLATAVSEEYSGTQLQNGVDLQLEAGAERRLRVC